MAKVQPSLTLAEMESKLGYRVDSAEVDSIAYHCDRVQRFYSSFRPVPNSTYERTKEEFEVYKLNIYRERSGVQLEEVLPELDVAQMIRYGDDVITVARRSHVLFYSLTLDIHYDFGFNLSLLVTNEEAHRTLSVAKLHSDTTYKATSMLLKLPRQLRNKIYALALPKGKCNMGDSSSFNEHTFTGGIGDPSGFCFPLSKNLTILRVDRQMRQEALPLAYRGTVFQLDDIDDLIRLLITVGKAGRENIESLDLDWESRMDSERKWEEDPDYEGPYLTLPTLHVAKCVQLLKQCKRLTTLRLYIESDIILNMPSDAYKTNPGIRELCSVRGIKRVDIWGLDHEPLEQHGLVKYLKREMESPGEESVDEMRMHNQA